MSRARGGAPVRVRDVLPVDPTDPRAPLELVRPSELVRERRRRKQSKKKPRKSRALRRLERAAGRGPAAMPPPLKHARSHERWIYAVENAVADLKLARAQVYARFGRGPWAQAHSDILGRVYGLLQPLALELADHPDPAPEHYGYRPRRKDFGKP